MNNRSILLAGVLTMAAAGAAYMHAGRAATDAPMVQTAANNGDTARVQTVAANNNMSIYDFKMKSLTGDTVDLSKYKGKVVMVVNVASKCGNTPQYADLEAMYTKYKGQGFMILGFPSNDFGQQEPGTNAEIGQFCTKNYGVDFDMFSKIDVKGPNMDPLYGYLTTSAPETGDIHWNFEKFIISRDGKIAYRFAPGTKPSTPEVVGAVESELKKS